MLTETLSATIDEPAVTLENFRLADEDLPEFRDMKFEDINQLDLDHPGASDEEYRERRDHIADLARRFRETGEITDGSPGACGDFDFTIEATSGGTDPLQIPSEVVIGYVIPDVEGMTPEEALAAIQAGCD